ncbi:MAG: putative ATPase/class 3 adenylate cyclase [Ilumatobacter sp.]|jgi:predicted ATPase/class 3 adenylate cyclase
MSVLVGDGRKLQINMSATTPPTGELTFLFTDVEGSSAMWEQDSVAMGAALAEHDRRLDEVSERHGGYIFTTAGDSYAVAFPDPMSALAATLDAQLMLAQPAPGPKILVRMGIHTGTAIERAGDYFGPVLNRCARLMSVGHGGQVLVSGTTAKLLRGHIDTDWQLVDLGEHRLKDLAVPEHIFQLGHPELPAEFAPLRTMDAGLNNLPLQLTTFVGRTQELEQVGELLGHLRLVTLAGSGGSGKTRLALQLAIDHTTKFTGGVVLVELAAITDPTLLDDTIATAFKVQESAATQLIDAVANKVGGRSLLLVVDNCERLIDSVAQRIAHLLERCPNLTVLATSQAPLGVGGEAVYRVPSLSLPDVPVDAATALGFDAIELFVDRAILARPSFEVTAENVTDIVAICQRIDGIPLALELAAARLSVLTPHQVRERLNERFKLLRRGQRSAYPRHQTLETTISWSHDLLQGQEKALFRRCGIFAGTFDLDAVEEVCPGGPINSDDVLDLLAALIDKSLVVAEEDGTSIRYRMLESIRDYAGRKLAGSSELIETSVRHLAYFTAFTESLQQQYRSEALAEALAGSRTERENIRAALDFALEHGQLEDGGRIIGAIGYLWYTDGAFREGIDWCERLFSHDLDLSPHTMAAALHAYGTLLGSWSDPVAGGDLLERAVELRRGLNEPLRLAGALNNLGNQWNDAGRHEDAEASLIEAVDLYRAAGENPSMSLASLGFGRMFQGDYEGAMAFFDEAISEASRAHNALGVAVASSQAGQCAACMGRPNDARPLLADARSTFAELGIAPGLQDVELTLAIVERDVSNRDAAIQHLLTFLKEPDSHWYLAGKFWALQIAASLLDDLSLGAEVIGAADAYYASVKEVQPIYFRRDCDATREHLTAALGNELFTTRYQAGASRTHRDVVALTAAALNRTQQGRPRDRIQQL